MNKAYKTIVDIEAIDSANEGFWSNLFSRATKPIGGVKPAEPDRTDFKTIVEFLKAKIDEVIEMSEIGSKYTNSVQYTNRPGTVSGSRLGGIPYIPSNVSKNNIEECEDMEFIAQINLSDLTFNPYPAKKGILQFFAGEAGAETGCVLYYPTIDNKVTFESSEDLSNKTGIGTYSDDYIRSGDDRGYGLKFLKEKTHYCIMPPDDKISKLYDKYIDDISPKLTDMEKAWNNFRDAVESLVDDNSHNIFPASTIDNVYGYPGSVQFAYDEDNYDENVILLQLSSNDDMVWGDYGIGHWMISEKDLKKKMFSKATLYWDCY